MARSAVNQRTGSLRPFEKIQPPLRTEITIALRYCSHDRLTPYHDGQKRQSPYIANGSLYCSCNDSVQTPSILNCDAGSNPRG